MDNEGIIHIGGRLRHAKLNDDVKQPYIIPQGHPIARLIIEEAHNTAHLGTEWVLSNLRRKYWIPKARSLIKKLCNRCVTCRKLFSPPIQQKMADLPPERLEPNKPPFSYIGLDCFGPIYVKLGRAEVERYGCIFTCLNTRAIHIEKLEDVSTDSFINGLRRFICWRGKPEKIWCDNGTNFKGAEAELKRSLKSLNQNEITSYCSKLETEWKFIPPGASHMGGIWERMIRTIRKIFLSLLSSTRLLDETLETTFCEIESIINGRPLTKISDDIDDPTPLTPNHLLLLREGYTIPAGKFEGRNLYRKRWQQVQHLAEQFWRRWLKEYLPELQHRNKWTIESQNLKKGDLVLIMNENTPRNLWPMGLVTEVNTGHDGLVRSVKIKTKSTYLVRPISKVVLLEGSCM